MPVGNVLVGDSGGDVKHNDTALAVDIVSISQTTELLLTGSIPHIEDDLAKVLEVIRSGKQEHTRCPYRAEFERVNLDAQSSNILLLEFTCQVTLDEGGLRKVIVSSCTSYPPRWARLQSTSTARIDQAAAALERAIFHTLPVPPSPTSTSLKVGIVGCSAIVFLKELLGSFVLVGFAELPKISDDTSQQMVQG